MPIAFLWFFVISFGYRKTGTSMAMDAESLISMKYCTFLWRSFFVFERVRANSASFGALLYFVTFLGLISIRSDEHRGLPLSKIFFGQRLNIFFI